VAVVIAAEAVVIVDVAVAVAAVDVVATRKNGLL